MKKRTVIVGVVIVVLFIISLVYPRKKSTLGDTDIDIVFNTGEEGGFVYIPEEYDGVLEDETEVETDESIVTPRPTATVTIPVTVTPEPTVIPEDDDSEESSYNLYYYVGAISDYVVGVETEAISQELWDSRDTVLAVMGDFDSGMVMIDIDRSSMDDQVVMLVVGSEEYLFAWEESGNIIVGLTLVTSE